MNMGCCCETNPPGTRCYQCNTGNHVKCDDNRPPLSADNINRDPKERTDTPPEFAGKIIAIAITALFVLVVILMVSAYVIAPLIRKIFHG